MKYAFLIATGILMMACTDTAVAGEHVRVNKMTVDASRLWSPGKLAADHQGSIFVVDGYKGSVRVFDSKGNYRKKISVPNPSAVAAANGMMYIGSHSRYSVAVFRNDEVIGYLGAPDNEFRSIADIAIDEGTGDVYVADTKAGQVKVYYASGISKMTLASGIHAPVAVSVTDSSVFVLDTSVIPCAQTAQDGGAADPVPSSSCTRTRISVLDKNGSLVRSIADSGDDLLRSAQDLAVDRFSNIYVADTSRKAVLVFDRQGTFIGQMTSDLDELRLPVAVAVSPQGTILVASSETHCIWEIDLAGSRQSEADSSLSFTTITGAPVPLAAVGY